VTKSGVILRMTQAQLFHDNYLQFAQLCRISHHGCQKPQRSVFPYIQHAQTSRCHPIPEDMVLFPSGGVISCVLSQSNLPDLDLIGGATVLLSLNAMYRIAALWPMCRQGVNPQGVNDLRVLLKALRDVVEQYVPIVPKELTPVNKGLSDAEQKFGDASVMQRLVEQAGAAYGQVLGHFFSKVNLGELIQSVLRLLLDVQVVGIFEIQASAMEAFQEVEGYVIESVRAVLLRQQEGAVQLLQQTVGAFDALAQQLTADKPLGVFRSLMLRCAGQTAGELAQVVSAFNFTRLSDQLVIWTPESSPQDLSDGVFSVVDGGASSAESLRALAVKLSEQPQLITCCGICVQAWPISRQRHRVLRHSSVR